MASYTIKDLEKLSGIKAHTIRIWEKRYSLVEPKRTDTNIRTYCDQDLKKLLNISMLNRNGYKISKIALLSDIELYDKIEQLTKNVNDTESQIENLTIAMLELDEDKFEKSLSRSIIHLGFEDTISKIIYPFFIKIGIMWQTGTVNPVQEHFVSNLIRQKLIVAIDSQVLHKDVSHKSFMFFLPEGELHELGLLFYTYLTRKRGHKTLYIGQWVPYNDIKSISESVDPDIYVTSFFSLSKEEAVALAQQMSDDYPNKQIFITGGMCKELIGYNWPNIKICPTPENFIFYLENISAA
jgi:DNA-binding transcriptional MerR regulator